MTAAGGRGVTAPVGAPPRLRARLADDARVRSGLVVFALLALAVVAFGSHVGNGGLYYDDWTALAIQRYPSEPGLLGAVHDYVLGGTFVSRPGMGVLLAITNAALGAHAGWHLALAVLLAVALSVAFYFFLRAVGLEARHAAPMAALLLLFPWSDSTRLWSTVSLYDVGITAFLAGATVALQGLRTRGRRAVAWHALAAALYLASVLIYEVTAGVALVTGLIYATRTRRRGALARWAVDLTVVGAALLLLRSTGTRTVTGVSESIAHGRAMADQAATVLAAALTPFGSAQRRVVGGVLIAVLAAGAGVWWLHPEPWRRREARRWLILAAAGTAAVALAYAPYLPAGNWYEPLQPGQGNRVNAFAALGYVGVVYAAAALLGTLLAAALRAGSQLAMVLTAAWIAAVGLGYLHRIDGDEDDWARAARMQAGVLDAMHRAEPRPSAQTTLYAFGFQSTSAPGVPVFLWVTDLSGAVRVTYADRSLAGYPMIPGAMIACGARYVEPTGGGYSPALATPYGRTVFLDVATGRRQRIADRAGCLAAARRLGAAA